MATSPIYSWPEPDNTDLVKNGALAIRTLGNAIDTTMGTMVAKTVVDAKGDLIAGTAADTVNRLAVGNNGETLVADSSTSTGLRYTAGNPIPNPIINSGFDIWQRGTSFTPNTSTYLADRWQMFVGATGTTVTRQTTGDTTNLPFIQYCMRVSRDSGNTGTNVRYLNSPMETVNSIPLAGKTVTFSFYARKGATFSGSIVGNLVTGTGTDQNPLVVYTGAAIAATTTPTLTTTWQRFTATGTFPATATEYAVAVDWTPTGTAGATDYFEVTGVQVDVGSVALPYRRNGATLQGELAACQRYFYNMVSGNSLAIGNGAYFNPSNLIGITVRYPVFMRVAPTLVNTSGTDYYAAEGNGGTDLLNTFLFRRASVSTGELYNNSEALGVQGLGASIITNNASSSISFNAEL
jgi:hypothetical protein